MKERYVTAATAACNEATRVVGTLVVTPGEGGTSSVVVVVAYDKTLPGPEACTPPEYAGCIVARRRFAFTEHRDLRMPITIDPECKGKACDAFSTCRLGVGVDALVDTDVGGGGSVKEPGESDDGGIDPSKIVDASPGGPDATAEQDAGADAAADTGTDASQGSDAGAETAPFCTGGAMPSLICVRSGGTSMACSPGMTCCGQGAPSCTPACVAPDRHCCSNNDCNTAGGERCAPGDGGTATRFCSVGAPPSLDGGAMIPMAFGASCIDLARP